jgi:AcrR family transcriptional regulator
MMVGDQLIEDPKDKIRIAARKLICEKGIDKTTTRDIASEAGVNIAAINYHFGGKDNLAVEVFREVARRSAQYRLEQLTALEEAAVAEGRPLRIFDVVQSFVSGYFREDSPSEGELLANLIIKNRLAPTEWTSRIITEEIDGMAVRYIDAIQAAAPTLSYSEVCWRYHLMVGTVLIALNHNDHEQRIERLSGGQCSLGVGSELREHLVDFIVDGIKGPPPTG